MKSRTVFDLETISRLHVSRFEQNFHSVRATKVRGSTEAEAEGVTNMITEGNRDFSSIYSIWFGKSVVLLVAIRQCPIPVPCSTVCESAADVRVRIKPGWEMNLRKELILAVEEYAVVSESQMN